MITSKLWSFVECCWFDNSDLIQTQNNCNNKTDEVANNYERFFNLNLFLWRHFQFSFDLLFSMVIKDYAIYGIYGKYKFIKIPNERQKQHQFVNIRKSQKMFSDKFHNLWSVWKFSNFFRKKVTWRWSTKK